MHQISSSSILNWFVLHQLKHSFLSQVRSFLVFGDRGTEVLLITKNDCVYAFGDNKWPSLPLGHRNSVSRDQPEEIVELRHQKIIDLVYGQRHVMAITEDGGIYSWGDNRFGQLGSLNTFESLKPMLVGNHIVSLACGANHTLALTSTGQVFAWGRNNYGQIGIGSNIDQLIPVKVAALEPFNVKMIKCGSSHSFALTDDGQLYAFGGNSFGQLGIGNCTHQTNPTLVKFNQNSDNSTVPISVACGEYHSLFLMSNGDIFSCGRNDSSQLGCIQVPNSEGSCIPVKISTQERFIRIASHFATNFSAAVSTNGYCFVWGVCANEERPIRQPRQTPLISLQDTFVQYCRPVVTPYLYDVDKEERIRMKTVGSRIIQRLRQSFNDRKTSDIEFIIDNKSIFVHRWFLQFSNAYLNRMLSDEWLADQKTIEDPINNHQLTQIRLRTYSYEVFYAYFQYLYSDILELDGNSDQACMEMLELADCYLDSDLKQKCINIMKHNLSTNNCCQYYQLAIRYDLKEFEKEIIIFVFNNIFEVCRSTGFKLMTGDLCKALLVAIGQIA